MNFSKFKLSLILVCLLVFQGLHAQEELLTTSDVSKVMKQIFDQHVDKKEMSSTVLKNAFRVYIDQFDPLRLYLLDEEVQPYLNISDAQITALTEQYKQNNFSAFEKLNSVIQTSIERARNTRHEVESNSTALFNVPAPKSDKVEWSDADLKLAFAKTPAELKSRLQKQIISFIDGEKKRYGAADILRNQPQTLAILNRYFEGQENSYLFRDDKGQPLNKAETENLLTLHVLKALAASLDAHTTFYNNTEAYDMKVRLEKAFQGIGVVLQQSPDGTVTISKLMEGGPAAKSGQILVNDQILSIDGKSLNNISLDKVMELIRGQNGSQIVLNIQRKVAEGDKKVEKTFEITLKREPITLNDERVDISYEQFGDGIIGKITLHAFYQGDNGISSENDLRKAIQDLSKKGQIRGLILDLRDNSGGFLMQAVKVVGMFIKNGVVVISKYSDGKEHFYRDMDGHEAYNGPLVVLVSKATASAAEIVAQALQDYGVAVVVGDEHTYGKGTIQSQTVTDNQATSFFKVTVGKYYTVSGKTPQIQGVWSDVVVPGIYSEEHIGEQYLEFALPADSIKPEYKDDLSDVDTGLRSWYLRYYVPTLQHRVDEWDPLIPDLKKNSETRIANNKNYQAFLRQLKGLNPEPDETEQEELKTGTKKNYNVDDLQMMEAVNVIKDMIMLNSKVHSRNFELSDAGKE